MRATFTQESNLRFFKPSNEGNGYRLTDVTDVFVNRLQREQDGTTICVGAAGPCSVRKRPKPSKAESSQVGASGIEAFVFG